MMRPARAPFALLALCALLGVGAARADPQGWSFIRSVGGLRVREPVRVNGLWRLPVRANVAGIESFTNRPTAQNPLLKCSSVLATIEGRGIYLTVDTAVQRSGGSARCAAAFLGHAPPGTYTVFYRSPEEPTIRLREVRISP
jgi:hypothetical protein